MDPGYISRGPDYISDEQAILTCSGVGDDPYVHFSSSPNRDPDYLPHTYVDERGPDYMSGGATYMYEF